jgi:hypothetical protein
MSPQDVRQVLQSIAQGVTSYLGKPQVWYAQVLMNPDVAKTLLQHTNICNRAIRPKPLADRITAMSSGEFVRTHQGVAWSEDNPCALIDGQHTLQAIIDSETSHAIMASVGWPKEVMKVIDSSPARSIANRLKLGYEIDASNAQTAAARYLYCGDSGGAKSVPVFVLAEVMQSYADGIDFSCTHLPNRKNSPLNGGVRGLVARAFYTVDHARLAKFCNAVTGVDLAPDEVCSVPVMVSKYVRNNGRDGEYAYQITQRALNAFLERRTLQTLKPLSGDLYPLPDD